MIALLPLDVRRIDALRIDPTRVDGIAVVDGALPPGSIVEDARVALVEGRPARWLGPYLFVDPRFAGADGGEADPASPSCARIVGSAVFKGEPDHGWVEIGYGVAPSCQRRGYATDGAFALVRLAFEVAEIRAVYAETSIVNTASRRVVQKVGFTHAGQRFSDDDGMVDCWFIEA